MELGLNPASVSRTRPFEKPNCVRKLHQTIRCQTSTDDAKRRWFQLVERTRNFRHCSRTSSRADNGPFHVEPASRKLSCPQSLSCCGASHRDRVAIESKSLPCLLRSEAHATGRIEWQTVHNRVMLGEPGQRAVSPQEYALNQHLPSSLHNRMSTAIERPDATRLSPKILLLFAVFCCLVRRITIVEPVANCPTCPTNAVKHADENHPRFIRSWFDFLRPALPANQRGPNQCSKLYFEVSSMVYAPLPPL